MGESKPQNGRKQTPKREKIFSKAGGTPPPARAAAAVICF